MPVAIAGPVGIHYSIEAFQAEMLGHLDQEVASRTDTIARLMAQLSGKILYLSASPALDDFQSQPATPTGLRLERDFSVFVAGYPYVYQIRYLDATGMVIVRLDRLREGLHVVPQAALSWVPVCHVGD